MNDIIKRFKLCRKYQVGGNIPIFQQGGWTPSKNILNKIKEFESWHQGWVDTKDGHFTTGWGFVQTPELKRKYPNGMTRQQADAYFNQLIPQMATRLAQLTPNWDRLNANQRDALFSAFYNIGEGTYRNKSPKFQKALQEMNWKEAANQMDWGYNQFKGLQKRRDYERQLFLTPM